ncbi:MAG TPA: MFS transporter [Candidatus Didemnitutus sp.]|nr:MFS transporter [Candidatus Didemnitutus sp.]
MSFGFLGIQFGWGLQMANMSPIYKYLGAADDQIARLWLAAPLTGLIVQPIIGALSDRTWCRLGRRRPYFLAGAILSSLALLLMPNSGPLAGWLLPNLPKFYMAAGLLWVLDASINISMEPFRAFVTDKLPEAQRGSGFAMQSLFIGLGAVLAGVMPAVLRQWFHLTGDAGTSGLPDNVRVSFYVGAAAFFGAVLWTIVSTPEDPPDDLEGFRRAKAANGNAWWREIPAALLEMPKTMQRLAIVQFFTWMGLFCMWLHFSNAVPVLFGSNDPSSDLFKRGVEWAGVCFAAKDAVTFFAAFGLMAAARTWDRRVIHGVCLVIGGLSLLAVGFIRGEDNKYLLLADMALGGLTWASILSMPYALLAGSLPRERIGVYMGIFNFFIVLPEILAALFFGGIVKNQLHGNLVHAVMAGGVCLFVATLALFFVPKTEVALSKSVAIRHEFPAAI